MSTPRPADVSAQADATTAVKQAAIEAGFGLCGITAATEPDTLNQFSDWLDAGFAGEMSYIERRRDAYADPESVLSNVKSVVMVALDYCTSDPAPPKAGFGRVSRYAWGDSDYHSVIREKLRPVADALHAAVPKARTRGIVDTAPLLERDFARRAGLGWFGKNTMLISKHRGSFFFLGALLTDADLIPDEPHDTSHCGTCTACLDVCPTQAFAGPYVLDARKCISYLTIELRDADIPDEHSGQLGDWLFGCDVCQDVCPWNTKAPNSSVSAFQPHIAFDDAPPGLIALDTIAAMNQHDFEARFQGTPIERTGLLKLKMTAARIAANQGARYEAE